MFSHLTKLHPSHKKTLNWLVFAIIVGVGFLLVQPEPRQLRNEVGPNPELRTSPPNATSTYAATIEKRLAAILSEVPGVGAVEVFATLAEGSELVVAHSTTQENRTTEENDPNGGLRTIHDTRETRTPVTLRLEGERKEVPLVIKEFEPVLRGLLIVAVGAENPDTRYRVLRAAQAALQMPMHRIEVLPKVKESR